VGRGFVADADRKDRNMRQKKTSTKKFPSDRALTAVDRDWAKQEGEIWALYSERTDDGLSPKYTEADIARKVGLTERQVHDSIMAHVECDGNPRKNTPFEWFYGKDKK
jgi:hypothetical protein